MIEQYTQNIIFPTVQIKDYNVMIDGQNFFYQQVKNNLIAYDNIKEIVTGNTL